MNLYLNNRTDYSIEDEKGNKYSIEEAKAVFNSGVVEDWNYSFERLVQFNWNMDAVRGFYETCK